MTTDTLNQHIEQLVEAVQVLASDVREAAKLSENGDTQFARRAYIRAAFALIEGNINLMAEVILDAMDRGEIRLLTKEVEILRQERQARDGTRPRFVSIQDRAGPVFEMFARLFEKTFRLDKGAVGWVDFNTAIKIRNRITHPKNAASFIITDSELNAIERAREWFAGSVEALLEEC